MHAVLRKVKIIRNFKCPGYIGVDKKGKYYLFDKFEPHKDKFEQGDIEWVIVSKEHSDYSYIRLTMCGDRSIPEFLKDLENMDISKLKENLRDTHTSRILNHIHNNDIGFSKYAKKNTTIAEAIPSVVELMDVDYDTEDGKWYCEAAQVLNYLYLKIIQDISWNDNTKEMI